MLSKAWAERSGQYDFIIIGSGYGGAITAARLATAALNPGPPYVFWSAARSGSRAITPKRPSTWWARHAATSIRSDSMTC